MIKNIDDNYSHYYHDHHDYHRHYHHHDNYYYHHHHLPQETEDDKERSRIQELRQISRGRLNITILPMSRPLLLTLTFSCQDPSEFRCTEFKKMMQAIFLSGGLFLYSNGFYLQYLTAVY